MIKEFLIYLFVLFGIIFFAFSVIAPMFGIAWLVDEYSEWLMLLYIPYMILIFKIF